MSPVRLRTGTLLAAAVLALTTLLAGAPAQARSAQARSAQAQSGKVQLVLDRALETLFVPPPGDDGSNPPRFEFEFYSRGPVPEEEAKNITASFDATALKGKATLTDLGYSCRRGGYVVTCSLGDVYQRTSLVPFRVMASPNAKLNDSRKITATFTGSNFPTVRHTTTAVIGLPELRTGAHPPRTGVKPGSWLSITPALANLGDVPVRQGLTVTLFGHVALAARHSNCRYAPDGTFAECDFPQPIAAGGTYELDTPLSGTVENVPSGFISYYLYPLGDPDNLTYPLPADAPRGDGPPVRLKRIPTQNFHEGPGDLHFTTTPATR